MFVATLVLVLVGSSVLLARHDITHASHPHNHCVLCISSANADHALIDNQLLAPDGIVRPQPVVAAMSDFFSVAPVTSGNRDPLFSV